jgi:hypothetical protein
LVEIESGAILLDGVDLSRLGLSDVRGRKNGMSIIPQVFRRFVSIGSPYRVVSSDGSLLLILSLMLARRTHFLRGRRFVNALIHSGSMKMKQSSRLLKQSD